MTTTSGFRDAHCEVAVSQRFRFLLIANPAWAQSCRHCVNHDRACPDIAGDTANGGMVLSNDRVFWVRCPRQENSAAQATCRTASTRLSQPPIWFQLANIRVSYLWNATRRSTVPLPETNGHSRDSCCGRSGTAVGTGLRGCSTNARASSILRALRRVTWAVTVYDDDDAGLNHRRVEPLENFALSRPERRRCQGGEHHG
jgi:hypothetical protein